MDNNPVIFLNINNEEKLYSFNFENKELGRSNISRTKRAANGYGFFIEVDKQKKLVAILGCEEFIFFYSIGSCIV